MNIKLNKSIKPFLSIVIPTYKRPKKLSFLLSLLVSQKDVLPDEWEIVVSDNSSGDSTKEVVDSYQAKIPRLNYYCHDSNIGSESNIFSLYGRASGDYVWLIPDDDQVESEYAVSAVIAKIKACVVPPSFVMLNAKAIDVETHELMKDRFNQISGDIYLSDGRDILNFITDLDLIGAQRLVIRRNIFPDPFIDSYMKDPDHLIPMVCALVASSKGPALVVGDTLAVFGDNDPTPWRVFWPYISLQLMPELLIKAAKELGYSEELVRNIINRRKYENYKNIIPYRNSHFIVFQKYSLSWIRLANLYGWSFILFKVIIGMPIALIRVLIPLKFIKYILIKFR
jgi:glycosyltransferase involved in cell wall biosynthesis